MSRRTTRTAAQKAAAKYDAAGFGRRIKSWNPPSTGPQRATEGLQRIRNRARDSARNDWAGGSSVQKWTTNLVGVGIVPRWTDGKITAAWTAHVKTCDADCVLDAYGMQTLGVRSWLDSGEVFLRRRPRSLDLSLPAPVQYQLIESDFCPLFDAETWPGMPVGNTINQGIERNKYGRRVAYWMYRAHPGDKNLTPSADQLLRIPASEIRHVFEPTRPGQLRGVSMLAPVLVRLRSSMDFEDAVLDRQKLANLFVAFVTRAIPDAADIDFDPDTGLPKWYSQDGQPLAGLEPGIMQELQPGENVTFANPPEAGTTFSEYLRSTHVGTAAGSGLPYEIMSGDIKDISDRTLRVIINEFRRFARSRQWQIVVPMLCQPMVDWWADAAVLSGALPMSKLDAAKAPKWAPEGWEYIHPVQDAEGKVKLIEAGIVSRASVIGERGDDPAEVDAERKADKEREDDMGLTPAPGEPGGPPAPKPAPSPAAIERERADVRLINAQAAVLERDPPPAVPPAAPDPQAMAMLHLMQASVAGQAEATAQVVALAAAVSAFVARPPETHVHNEVNPAPVNVNVEPTPLAVNVEAPTVNVEAPTVNVEAPTISITNEVQPAAVDVSVNLPDRKTVSVIDRDREGNISEVTQTETTITH